MERAHSTIKNLLKTSVQDNGTEWDKNLKIISMAHYNIKHDGAGFTPFQLTFGRDANLPSMLSTTPSVKYREILSIWKERNQRY